MAPTRGDYLFTEVMTAAPQKLQLLLVESALRNAQQARHHWEQGREDAACQALIRSQNVLVELFGVIDPKTSDPLEQRSPSHVLVRLPVVDRREPGSQPGAARRCPARADRRA